MIKLNGCYMNYAWGRLGTDSEVANLIAGANDSFKPDPVIPYAELWMGTHAKGMATLADSSTDGETLAQYLKAHPEVIGKKLEPVIKARKLHAADPVNYKDENHKPEMAIAVTKFELMCGFRLPDEIFTFIKETPELFELVGGPAFQKLEAVVSNAAPIGSDEAKEALQIPGFYLPSFAVNKEKEGSGFYILGELLIRLNYSFPGDIGVIMPFFLNHFVLLPGEAVYLGPNEPHAYLYGDCIECMANSDNVVRAGLTPKFKDVATLVSSLTYRMGDVESNKFTASSNPDDPNLLTYDPPAPEFAVQRLKVDGPDTKYRIPPLPVCSLAIVVNGSASVSSSTDGKDATAIKRGEIYLIPADYTEPLVTATASDGLTVYRAYTPESGIDDL